MENITITQKYKINQKISETGKNIEKHKKYLTHKKHRKYQKISKTLKKYQKHKKILKI